LTGAHHFMLSILCNHALQAASRINRTKNKLSALTMCSTYTLIIT
jgi:hypothetical protein